MNRDMPARGRDFYGSLWTTGVLNTHRTFLGSDVPLCGTSGDVASACPHNCPQGLACDDAYLLGTHPQVFPSCPQRRACRGQLGRFRDQAVITTV